jgi:anaerobic selenocysteine-containing dehydrogenase
MGQSRLPGEARGGSAGSSRRTAYRSCSLCEAGCGLAFELEGERILSVRGDEADVFSRGYVCPKGIAIADVHNDPDRLRTPLRRTAAGRFEPIAWNDALDLAAEKLRAIRARDGRDAIGVYLGNPIVHNHAAVLLRAGFLKAIGSHNCFSAGSQDTSPRFATSFYLFGSSLRIPVPDIDRTQYLLCVGANPWISNGSFMTAPDVRKRLRDLRARGGKLVVVDPRRSETAREADEWIAIRPGGDAAWLLALVQTLVADGRVDRARIAAQADGWEWMERVANATGVAPEVTRRIARELANAPSGSCYSRIGVCNNRFGTLATWATDVLNLAAGRLGEVGGAMFATPAVEIAAVLPMLGDGHDRWRSRVRGLPETLGDLPAAVMAEEMETPGRGQIRALVTYAGNPVLSVPNGRRLSRALEGLEFMVSIDIYLNETTRHADLILPPAWALAEDHFDLLMANHQVRNTARWCAPVVARGEDERADWEILLALAERMGGGATGIGPVDAAIKAARYVGLQFTPDALAALLIRVGPWGDRFVPGSKGLSREKLEAAPHGIDLGPLQPGITPRVLHRDKRVKLAPPPIVAALPELARSLDAEPARELLLIGRRELRTCNSWMHNVAALVSGRDRCVLWVNPEDAEARGLGDGDLALLESRVHKGTLTVELHPDLAPGAVSLPHGWGHAEAAPWQRVAGAHAGVSMNDWTDDADVERVVGQSILTGIPVRLSRSSG